MAAFLLDVNLAIKDVIGLEQVKQQITAVTGNIPVAAGGAGGGVKAASAQAVAAAAAQAKAMNQVASANEKVSKSNNTLAQTTRQASAATKQGAASANNFAQQIGLAGKRYAAFVTATAIPFAAIAGFREATQSVIEFDESVTRVRQITGQSAEEIAGLKQQFIDLSVATGTSAVEIANTTKTLAQAGIRGAKLTEAIEALSKVPLTPTFGSIESAVEGLLAVQNQFEQESLGVVEVFDVLTKVGNKYAATAEDLFQGFSRGGAAFAAVGGTFREFAAALAIVRQETRESATTVGTFFKTLSSRLADPKILEFLRGRGIELISPTGDFVGAIPAIRQISQALEEVSTTQEKVEIATRVAGRRQVSRFLALTDSVDKLDEALGVAGSADGEFNRIAEEGLTTLRAQLDIVGAKFIELFQTLAEPVFIPLIQGFTQAATGAAAFITAISPVIPILTEITLAAVGIKAVTVAITALATASTKLAGLRLAGFANFNAQNLKPAGFVGPVNQTGVGAASAGAASRVASGFVALAKSQLGQIAALGLAIPALDSFANSAKEAGNSSAELAAEFAKTVAALSIGASLISGKSVSAIGKGLFSSLSGALLGIGGLLAAGIYTAGQIGTDAIKQKVDQAASQIRAIEINIDDGIEQEIQSLGTSILDKIREAADRFRDTDTGEQSIGQFFTQAGKGLSDLVSGQRGLFDPTIDATKFIDEALKNAGSTIDEIFTGAVREFGTDFRKGLIDSLAEIPGASREAAVAIADRIIANVGQATRVTALSQASAERQKAAQQKLAEQAENVAARLAKISVPGQLASQLDLLSESVKRTVTSIDANISAFDALAGSIDTLQAPDLGVDISDQAITGFLKDPTALTNLLGDSFGELSSQTQDVVLFREAITQLTRAFSASRAEFEQAVNLEDPQADPSVFVKEFISKFVDSLGDVPPSVAARLQAAGQRVTSELAKNIVPKEDVFGEIEKSLLGQLGGIGDTVSSDVKTILENALKTVNFGLERESLRLETLAGRISEAGIADAFDQVLGEIDSLGNFGRIDFRSTDLIGQVEDISLALAGSDQFFQQYSSAAQRAAQATSELQTAIATNAANIPEAAAEFQAANEVFLRFKFIAQESLEAVDRAISNIDTQAPGAEQLRLDLSFLRQELQDSLKNVQVDELLRATDLKDQPITFEGAVDKFGENVNAYAKATQQLISSLGIQLTPDKVTQSLTAGTGGQIISVSEPGVRDVRILNTGEIASSIAKTPQDTIEQNRAAFGVDNIQSLFADFEDAQARIVRQRDESGLLPIPESQVFETALQEVIDKQLEAAKASGEFAGNIKNLPKNIEDLLTGKFTPQNTPPAALAAIDQGTRQELAARSEFRASEVAASASANLARTAAAEAETSAERAAAIRAAIETGGTDVETAQQRNIPSFEERFGPEIESLRQELQNIPQQQVIDIESLGAALDQRPATTDQTSAVDQAQLQSSISQAVTASVQAAIPQIQTTDTGRIAPTSATDVSESASQLAVASQATQETASSIVAGGEALRAGTQELAFAAEGLSNGLAGLTAIIDTRPETTSPVGSDELVNITSESVAVNRENLQALRQQNEAITALTSKISELSPQERQQQTTEGSVEIEGLDDVSNATTANSEALASNNSNLQSLSGELAKTQQALSEGLTARLEAIQTLQINVEGLDRSVEELAGEFEEVATVVAKKQVQVALRQLANELGNAELSQTARSIADGLV